MASATTKIVIRATDLASKPIRGVGGAIAALGRTVGRMRFMLLGLGTALGGFGLAREFITANSELEQMRMRIGSLLGDMKAGNQAIEWVREFQKQNPVRSIQEFSQTFEDLVAAGINPANGAMKALTAGSLKFGLTADDVAGVTKAFRQLTGITNAQKEEINQIAQRIPGTMQILASEMGQSQEKIRKDMKAGLVSSQEVAKAILRGLGKNADETIKNFGNTWQSVMLRLQSAWFDLLTRIGETGIFDKVKAKVDQFTSFVNANMEKIVTVAATLLSYIGDIAATLFGMSTGFEFKLKPMLLLVTDLIAQVGVFFAMIKTALVASVALVTKLSNVITNMAARGAAFEEGILIPTNSNIEEEIKKFERIQKRFHDASSGELGGREGRAAKFLVQRLGGIDEVTNKVERLRSMLQDVKADINETPVEFDLDNALDGLDQASDKMNNLRKETAKMIKDWDPNKPTTSGNSGDDRFKNLMTLLNDPDRFKTQGLGESMQEQAKVVEDSWVTSLEKIQEQFSEKFGTMTKIGARFAEGLNTTLSRNFSSFFDQLIDGHIPRLKNAIESFLKDILRMITDMMSQKLAMEVTQSLLSVFIGAQGAGGGTANVNANTAAGVNGAGFSPNTAFKPTVRGKAGDGQMNMKVEVLNQSNELIQATETRSRYEFGQQIMTVVLDSVRTNKGGSRDALRAGLA
jgi:tape measure domain-containing protein